MAEHKAASQPQFISVREAAKRLGVSTRTIEREAARPGGLPLTRIGRRVLFNVEALDRWAAARTVAPCQDAAA